MSQQSLLIEPPLERLEAYLREERYAADWSSWYLSIARRFLGYLEKRKIAVEAAQPAQVSSFLKRELAAYQRRHGRPPRDIRHWGHSYTAAIHHLLRLVQGQWPPQAPPANAQETCQREVCAAYVGWLAQARGLRVETRARYAAYAQQFLRWLGERRVPERWQELTVGDIDAYLAWRTARVQRQTCRGITTALRSFLRYLYAQRRIDRDLATLVAGPMLYAYESIPSALSAEHVRTVLEVTRKDRTPKGRRDFAMLMLLATYGLRAGEVVRLRLDDVDWRGERLRVRPSKTGAEFFLPLLESVGHALLDYLRHGRPPTAAHEIFIRARAPYRPFRDGHSLYPAVAGRLKKAGLPLKGKHGPHAFRHACAVGLLKATVPMKTIGDILGHRSTASTAIYLKLATEDLRAVGLEVPGEVLS